MFCKKTLIENYFNFKSDGDHLVCLNCNESYTISDGCIDIAPNSILSEELINEKEHYSMVHGNNNSRRIESKWYGDL